MYIVIELQTNVDGTVGNLVYAYDNINEAENKFYMVLASAAISLIPIHSVVLLDNTGICLRTGCYRHEAGSQE